MPNVTMMFGQYSTSAGSASISIGFGIASREPPAHRVRDDGAESSTLMIAAESWPAPC
jgi:hypothetical protein